VRYAALAFQWVKGFQRFAESVGLAETVSIVAVVVLLELRISPIAVEIRLWLVLFGNFPLCIAIDFSHFLNGFPLKP
jgi:hypothetical protein